MKKQTIFVLVLVGLLVVFIACCLLYQFNKVTGDFHSNVIQNLLPFGFILRW
jgi:hypothetical protein